MIVGDGRVLAVVNPRLRKVFETGYELVPLGAIDSPSALGWQYAVLKPILN
jgi:hypothetical protein